MKVVQVIGLPGVGKTEGINSYLSTVSNGKISYLDIRDFHGRYKEKQFKAAIKATKKPLIAESACGIFIKTDYIIKVVIPIQAIYRRLLVRDKTLDEDYLSQLETQMIQSHILVTSTNELILRLTEYFK